MEVPFIMAELDTKERNQLHDSSFAWIDKEGERHLPINDEAHVRSAIARFNQTDFDEPDGRAPQPARSSMPSKEYGIDVSGSDDVAKAAKGCAIGAAARRRARRR